MGEGGRGSNDYKQENVMNNLEITALVCSNAELKT